MNIGIDGGALSITDDRLKVGVYRVAYNLVKEMQALSTVNDYRVYSFGRGDRGILELSGPNTHFIRLLRSGYQSVWQTVNIIQNPIDVYLGISQSIPFMPKILCDVRKIGFIYDVGFLDHPEYYPDTAGSLNRQTATLVKRSDHIITISHASKQALMRAYHVPDGKVTVSYLGVDARFTAKGNVHESKHPYFLFVGSLKPGKNVPFMIRAFADFLDGTKQHYTLMLVGSDYWLDPEIAETIAGLGLQERIQYVGHVPDDLLAEYYRGAVALLTVSKIEGFGLPAAEAMSAGCPVIASTAGSYPEVVDSAGILVDPKDRPGLVKAMHRMTEDSAFRTSCIAKGSKQAIKFSWHTFARSILTISQLVYRTSS